MEKESSDALVARVQLLEERLSASHEGWLTDKNILKRSFAIMGHLMLANIIIYFVILLLVGLLFGLGFGLGAGMQ